MFELVVFSVPLFMVVGVSVTVGILFVFAVVLAFLAWKAYKRTAKQVRPKFDFAKALRREAASKCTCTRGKLHEPFCEAHKGTEKSGGRTTFQS